MYVHIYMKYSFVHVYKYIQYLNFMYMYEPTLHAVQQKLWQPLLFATLYLACKHFTDRQVQSHGVLTELYKFTTLSSKLV